MSVTKYQKSHYVRVLDNPQKQRTSVEKPLIYSFAVEKPGMCPAPTGGPCVEACKTDSDCEGPDKCCFNGCGHTCMMPGM